MYGTTRFEYLWNYGGPRLLDLCLFTMCRYSHMQNHPPGLLVVLHDRLFWHR